MPDDRGRKLVAGKRDRHPPSYPANRRRYRCRDGALGTALVSERMVCPPTFGAGSSSTQRPANHTTLPYRRRGSPVSCTIIRLRGISLRSESRVDKAAVVTRLLPRAVPEVYSCVASLDGLERALLRRAFCNRRPQTGTQSRKTGMLRNVVDRRSASGTCMGEAP